MVKVKLVNEPTQGITQLIFPVLRINGNINDIKINWKISSLKDEELKADFVKTEGIYRKFST